MKKVYFLVYVLNGFDDKLLSSSNLSLPMLSLKDGYLISNPYESEYVANFVLNGLSADSDIYIKYNSVSLISYDFDLMSFSLVLTMSFV